MRPCLDFIGEKGILCESRPDSGVPPIWVNGKGKNVQILGLVNYFPEIRILHGDRIQTKVDLHCVTLELGECKNFLVHGLNVTAEDANNLKFIKIKRFLF